jgi:hypothetical protein
MISDVSWRSNTKKTRKSRANEDRPSNGRARAGRPRICWRFGPDVAAAMLDTLGPSLLRSGIFALTLMISTPDSLAAEVSSDRLYL